MKKKQHGEKDNSERWLLSYADFITLLMVFFIIMYSISAVNLEKFRVVAQSFSAAMSGNPSGNGISNGDNPPVENPADTPSPSPSSPPITPDDALNQAEQDALQATADEIQKLLEEYGLQNSVKLRIDDRGLVLTLMDAATFESGSADIMPSFVPSLIKIATILDSVNNYIRIEGHTDNVPVTGGKFASNWEVSTARAISIVELFIQNSNIPPEKLSAVGYGEYRPIASNDTPEGRAQNRRVEIVVIRSKYNSVEASDATAGAAAITDTTSTDATTTDAITADATTAAP